MALYSYGPISSWPYIVMALHMYPHTGVGVRGRRRREPDDTPARDVGHRIAVEADLCAGIYRGGPVVFIGAAPWDL